MEYQEGVTQKLEAFRDNKETITIGGRTSQQLEDYVSENGSNVSSTASRMLKSHEFKYGKVPLSIDVVRLKAEDIVGNKFTSTGEIIDKALELGLELCPAEVGPYYRVSFKNQEIGRFGHTQVVIAMKPITFAEDDKRRFALFRFSEDSYQMDGAPDGGENSPLNEFVFKIPNQKS